jgi:hypothetical protein
MTDWATESFGNYLLQQNGNEIATTKVLEAKSFIGILFIAKWVSKMFLGLLSSFPNLCVF